MRRIPTRIHGIFDYLIGLFLMLVPWLFGYVAIGGPETWVAIVVGFSVILYSLLTQYELGVFGTIPMRAHLWLDGIAGFTLLVSLVFFGFFDVTYWTPHLIAGILLIVAPLVTEREPEHRFHVERPHH